MRADRRRTVAAACVLAVAALGAWGCGEAAKPYRIGVIVDCEGVLRSLRGDELAGAQIPLIQRGGRLAAGDATDGVTHTTVAGRPVQLVTGCTEGGEFSTLTQEARRLIENEHVDALVAGTWAVDSVVLRSIARAHPDVIVIPVLHGPREVTLRGPPRNLFRVAADETQSTAGLGTYVFRELGWRRAAIVYADWIPGWGPRESFVREFCSLGGRVTTQVPLDGDVDPIAVLPKVPRGVDGIAVFSGPPVDPSQFLNGIARRLEDPPRELVIGAGITAEPDWLRNVARALAGVVGSSYRPAAPAGSRLAYRRAFTRAFPGRPLEGSDGPIVGGFRNAVEAIAASLERADGDPRRVPAALAGLHADLLGVPTRLDRNRQAIVPAYLVRILPPHGGPDAPVRLAPVRTIPGIDQSVGGLVPADRVPTDGPLACRAGPAPSWAG